jgi:NADPH:quinone reductase-like Zn-dependent oxidoreductase
MLRPVIAGTMPLADAAVALQRIVGRRVSGKLILTP